MIINSRPLSYVSTEDLQETLTPSHLLIGHRLFSLPMDQFWKRWRKEYLLELRECHRYGKWTQSPCDPIVIGDIVLVYDQDHPRTFWRLAKVEDLMKGSDGKIRGAII